MEIYEVKAVVAAGLHEAYERYMIDQHIPDVLKTGAFTSAVFERSMSGTYVVRYMADTREILERYLVEQSPGLREDFAAHFPEGIELSRDERTTLASFNE